MSDFLTFKTFISIDTLIVFYYLGAVVVPAVSFWFVKWIALKLKMFNIDYEKIKTFTLSKLNTSQKFKIYFFALLCFTFMELFWRIFFEYLIAYMQIRDALVAN